MWGSRTFNSPATPTLSEPPATGVACRAEASRARGPERVTSPAPAPAIVASFNRSRRVEPRLVRREIASFIGFSPLQSERCGTNVRMLRADGQPTSLLDSGHLLQPLIGQCERECQCGGTQIVQIEELIDAVGL